MVKGEADAREARRHGRERTVFLCWRREMAKVPSRATFLTLTTVWSDRVAPAAR